jgi:integral membrane protein
VSLSAALLRYRVMAYVTGTLLLILVLIAMPLQFFADEQGPVAVVGTAHGFLFMVYLLTGIDVAFRRRWSLLRTGLVLIAGTVPFASFFAERSVTQEVRGALA